MDTDPQFARSLALLGYLPPGTAPDPTLLERLAAFVGAQMFLSLVGGVLVGGAWLLAWGVRALIRSTSA